MFDNPTLPEIEEELELTAMTKGLAIKDDDDESKLKQNAQESASQKKFNDQEPAFFQPVKSGQTSKATSSVECKKDGHQEGASQKNLSDQEVVESGQTSEATSSAECKKDGHQEGASQKNLSDQVIVESGQTSEATSSVECKKDGHQESNIVVVESGQALYIPTTSRPSRDEKPELNADRKRVLSLLRKISCSSVSEELDVLKELQVLTAASNSVQIIFGQLNWFFSNKLLKPKLIVRSYSDASLLSVLLTIVMNITSNYENKVKFVKDCPAALPFLVTSLSSQNIKTRRLAVAIVAGLASEDSNSKKIGESGGIKPLVELIEEGDMESLMFTGYAILNLCRVAENMERAVSEGAVTAVMGKVVERVLVEEMLQVLEMLSRHERAIEEMEEYGILECLFEILGEDVGENGEEYCVTIIHRMCHASSAINTSREIKEVANAREILERLVCTGTPTSRAKVNELLSRLQELAKEESSNK